MRTRDAVLADVNSELPDYDWGQGARRYLDGFFERYSRAQIEDFVATKPLAALTPEDPAGSLAEVVGYLNNFANALDLLKLPRGARILDVACGSGWVSHWLTRLGYRTTGLDISAEFVALARKRLLDDPYLALKEADVAAMFAVVDLENDPAPQALRAAFDVAILESCLHHFLDPITALERIRECLAPGGVVLIIEGENRAGAIRPEYMQVMHETQTLERPYPRANLLEILSHAGFPAVEFMGAINGFFPQSASLSADLTGHLRHATVGANICLCAMEEASLRRFVPSHNSVADAAAPAPLPDIQPPVRVLAGQLRNLTPAWLRPILRPFGRLVFWLLRRG